MPALRQVSRGFLASGGPTSGASPNRQCTNIRLGPVARGRSIFHQAEPMTMVRPWTPFRSVSAALTIALMLSVGSARAETNDEHRLHQLASQAGTNVSGGDTLWVKIARADVSGPPDRDGTALHDAAIVGAVEAMKELLLAGGNPDQQDRDGNTALHIAADASVPTLAVDQSVALIRLLLEARAKPDIANAQGLTPLHLASASHDRPDGVAELLRAGAAPNAQDPKGDTPLHIAVSADADASNVAVVDALLAGGANPNISDTKAATPLHLAAELGKTAIISALLEHDASPELIDSRGMTPLLLLIQNGPGQPEPVEALLRAGADPDGRDPKGNTPLHIAIFADADASNVAVVDALLVAGANPQLINSYGVTPILAATMALRPEIITSLVAAGATPDIQHGESGETPLHEAAFSYAQSRNDYGLSTVQALLAAGANPNSTDFYGNTALDLLSYGDNIGPILALLLAYGANPNSPKSSKDQEGQTPLSRSILHGNIEAIKILIQMGANPHIRNADGTTPMDLASSLDSYTELSRITQTTFIPEAHSRVLGLTPLHFLLGMFYFSTEIDPLDDTLVEKAIPSFRSRHFSSSNLAHRTALLLDTGINPNTPLYHNWNALHVLAHYADDIHAINLFIDAGASVNQKSDSGDTPLHLEIMKEGRASVVSAFIKAGANLNILDSKGKTVLHHAARRGHKPILSLLLKAGADPNLQDAAGHTSLHAVLDAPHEVDKAALIQELVKEGANPNIANLKSISPLHLAAKRGALSAVVALIDAGANPAFPAGHTLWTALHFAAAGLGGEESAKVVKELIAAGADPDSRNDQLRTPLHLAASSSNVVVLKALLVAGSDVDSIEVTGKTALHLAADLAYETRRRENAVETVLMLLQAEANPNVADQDGRSPLHLAAHIDEAGFWEGFRNDEADYGRRIASLLLEAGANANAVDAGSKTPLHLAVANTTLVYSAFVQTLLAANANPNATDATGATPLHTACSNPINQGVVVVLALLHAGANPNATDGNSRTPLHLAASLGQADQVSALLNAGADANIRDTIGNTPLMNARGQKVLSLLKRVDKWGANVDREFASASCDDVRRHGRLVKDHACDYEYEHVCLGIVREYDNFAQQCKTTLQACKNNFRKEVNEEADQMRNRGEDPSTYLFAMSFVELEVEGHVGYTRDGGFYWTINCK